MLLDEIRALLASARRGKEDLKPYQTRLIEFMHRTPFSAAFVDMGLGKTVSTLTLLDHLLQGFSFKRALVIAPIRVARQTWPAEIGVWRHTAALGYSLIRGEDDDPEVRAAKPADRTAVKEALRRRAMASNAPIHIINREAVDWLVDRAKEQRHWPYDVVIVDESSAFKDHKSGRFKALAAVRPHIKRMHQLTASPVAENYMGLFAQTYLLDLGKRFGKHITPFREKYFDYNPYSRVYKIKPGAEEQITDKIADLTIVMKARDYLPMDEPRIITRYVDLTPRERAVYDQMQRTLLAEMTDGTVIEAVNAGALNSKLTQLASGAVYDSEGTIHHIHEQKIEELRQIVEETRGRPILVGYWYRSSLERLQKAFPQATVMDRLGKAVGPWNAGKIPLLFAHPMGAGHGLNMQLGPGHILAFFDIPWSFELYQQLIGRLARQGQTNPVIVYHLAARNTVDETILAALERKESAQDRLFERLQRLHKRA